MKNYISGVRPEGGRLVFKVESNSRGNIEHTVDLEAYKFNGACDCEAFNFQCETLLKRGAYPKPHLQCRHIKKARDWLLNECLPQLIDHFNGPEPAPKNNQRDYKINR